MVIHSFDEMLQSIKERRAEFTVVAACPEDATTLSAISYCRKSFGMKAILVGDRHKIVDELAKLGENEAEYEVLHEDSKEAAAAKAVACVKTGAAEILMKGNLDTSVLLKAVVNKETGIGASKVMSHLAFLKIPGYHKVVVLTDSGMLMYPTQEQLVEIIRNAVNTLLSMGYDLPRVGILAAVEKVNPKMPNTVVAEAIKQMNQSGEIANCVIEGPISYDVLMSREIAEKKGFQSEVAGDADVLVVSDITVGNILGKALTVSAGAEMAGLIVGAQAPIALTSRGAHIEEKINSLLLAALCCKRGE